jgi:hypothetical protein
MMVALSVGGEVVRMEEERTTKREFFKQKIIN